MHNQLQLQQRRALDSHETKTAWKVPWKAQAILIFAQKRHGSDGLACL